MAAKVKTIAGRWKKKEIEDQKAWGELSKEKGALKKIQGAIPAARKAAAGKMKKAGGRRRKPQEERSRRSAIWKIISNVFTGAMPPVFI